ncbi:GIY-YIG nuclease family protein [Actinomadura terrae]|uniref:GIY-YIG nuclease family protein n=1 Tax=Actinomadura terrae TaxID=604353 RepID=UPI001FA712A2|nr:hypothetical protein [Actinomadura terrae]
MTPPTETLATKLLAPDRLWTAAEVLARPTPVPAAPGVYGWHFDVPPHPSLPPRQLLYVGIAPRRMTSRRSKQTLRTRVRNHYRGNAEGSTLRRTLGCLLGLELRRVGSGTRMTFGKHGEQQLTAWMAEHALVCWNMDPEPWLQETELINQLDLPLNLDQNKHNAFHAQLTEISSTARQRARTLPILP